MDQINFSPRQIRRGMNASIWAAVMWSFYASFIAGPIMAGLELALDFTPKQIALINSMGQIFLPLQLVGLIIQERFFHRTHFWGFFAFIQFTMFGALGVLANYYFEFTPAMGFLLFSCTYAVSTIASSLICPIGMTWHADFVPKRASNAFWSKRNGMYMLFNMFAGIASGYLIDYLGQKSSSSYTIMLLLGMLFGYVSMYLQMRIPDPNPYPHKQLDNPLRLFKDALKHKGFRTIILFFSLQTAGACFSMTFAYVYLQKYMNVEMKTLQILIAISSAFSFLCAYFFRVVGTKYGRKPVLMLCTGLKAGEFLLWASLIPGNYYLDNLGNTIIAKAGLLMDFSAFTVPVGLLSALPIFLLSGFTTVGIASAQQSLITSQSERKIQGMAIAVMYSSIGLCGAIAGVSSGWVYTFLETVQFLGVFHPFNIMAMVSALVCASSVLLISQFHEDGAMKARKMVKILLTENPIRQVYQSYVMGQPLSEKSRVSKLQSLRGSMVTQELVADLYSPSSRVREEAIAHLNQINGKVDEVVVDELLKLATIPELGMRVQAMRALGRLHVVKARELAECLALSPESPLAQAAVFTIGMLGRPESRQILYKLLNNGEQYYDLQAAAAEALSRIGDNSDAEIIYRAFSSEDNPLLAKQILLALCRIWNVDGKAGAYTVFDSELKEPGETIEAQLRSFCNSRSWANHRLKEPEFEKLMEHFDQNEFDVFGGKIVLHTSTILFSNMTIEQLPKLLNDNGKWHNGTPSNIENQLRILILMWSDLTNLSAENDDDNEAARTILLTMILGCRNLLRHHKVEN